MLKRTIVALGVTAAFGFCQAASAAPGDDLNELREQIQQLKKQYEQRIQALEKRLDQAEKSAADAATQAGAAQVTAQQAAAQASSRPSAPNAFNPAISLILNGTYGNLSQDPNTYQLNGFVPTLGEVAPPERGLSLGESELALAANVDQNFRGTGIFSIAPDNTIAVEEAYLNTLSLPQGFTLKAGRFFSAIGYLNEVHAHAWDFTDAPLANKAFLGNQMADDGVQLRWVAPTETYWDLGVDLGRGREFPGGPQGGRNKNGFGAANLFTHVGGDIGTGASWQTGLAYLSTSPQERSYDDANSTGAAVTDSFTGRSRLWALSGVLKWAPNGNPFNHNFKLQGEYFQRTEDGTLTHNTSSASPLAGGLHTHQSGWYAQTVYQFMPMWRIGYRYDRLDAGTTSIGLLDSGALSAADFPILERYNPTRNTIMTDWSPSEFSRIRLQLAEDKSRMGLTDHQVFLQYIMSLGAHGAHTF